MLQICYFTNRKNPRFEWFPQSLRCQLRPEDQVRLLVVDYWAQANQHHNWTEDDVLRRCAEFYHTWGGDNLSVVPPKPSVWQGPQRLTQRDYFAAASARNTAVCFAPDGWLAFCDDLSVLMPGWMDAVRQAMQEGYIALGTYKKVKHLSPQFGPRYEVQPKEGGGTELVPYETTGDDYPVVYEPFPPGVDTRLKHVEQHFPGQDVVAASGGWMFGCSVALPVEALLRVNGFDEDNDAQGGEDYLCGMMLERAGYQHRFCKQMATLEDEDAHYEEAPMLRVIKKGPAFEARYPRPAHYQDREWDASHVILNEVLDGKRLQARNPWFGEGGLRGLRQRVLADGYKAFPLSGEGLHWCDGQDLREM